MVKLAQILLAVAIAVASFGAASQQKRAAAEAECEKLTGEMRVNCLIDAASKPEQAERQDAQEREDRASREASMRSTGVRPIQWRLVDKSLTDLLNDGWRIESTSFHQVFEEKRERELFSRLDGTAVGGAIAIASVPRATEQRFLLSKSGKWVACVVTLTAPLTAKDSICRALN